MKRLALAALALAAVTAAHAQSIDSYYSGQYSFVSLGSASGVPANYGGLTLKWDDPNTLLLGGAANGGAGAIYSIGVVRDANNHIVGFSGSASLYSTAPNIDGGLAYGPGNVLFATGYPVNTLMQIKPGSSSPDKTINLAGLGVTGSVGSVNFVPPTFGGSGRIKIVSYSTGGFFDGEVVADGMGTYDVVGLTQTATLSGGPEGIAYVPLDAPLFTSASMLVAEYGSGQISSYEVDGLGNPIVGTRRTFMTGLTGAEGAFIDPLTGDFLFSTFGGGNQVIRVSGFVVPEPGTMAALGLGVLALLRRRRARRSSL